MISAWKGRHRHYTWQNIDSPVTSRTYSNVEVVTEMLRNAYLSWLFCR